MACDHAYILTLPVEDQKLQIIAKLNITCCFSTGSFDNSVLRIDRSSALRFDSFPSASALRIVSWGDPFVHLISLAALAEYICSQKSIPPLL